MIFKIDPYKPASKSAKALANALGCQRLKKAGSRFRQKLRHTIINWGSSINHSRVTSYAYNQPSAVSKAGCKLRTFQALAAAEVPCLEWTTDINETQLWQMHDFKVYCRHTTTGHSGRGITIIEGDDEVPRAPLYTKGLQGWGECRIHIDKSGLVIDWQRKLRRNGSETPTDIRNHENNYVFCRNVSPPPEEAFRVATEAVRALGLDFGAIDMALVEGDDGVKPLVIEVNTAPGLEGTTLDNYVSYFRNGEGHERV